MAVAMHHFPGSKLLSTCLNPEELIQARSILVSSFTKTWLFCVLSMILYLCWAHCCQIDSMISDLGTEFLLTVEEDITSFLGIQIKTLHNKALLLTQTGLTNWILEHVEWHIVMLRILLLLQLPLVQIFVWIILLTQLLLSLSSWSANIPCV